MIKLVFCDMDGTLLDGQGNLPEGIGAMLAELKAHGVIFAPASGRQYAALLRNDRARLVRGNRAPSHCRSRRLYRLVRQGVRLCDGAQRGVL